MISRIRFSGSKRYKLWRSYYDGPSEVRKEWYADNDWEVVEEVLKIEPLDFDSWLERIDVEEVSSTVSLPRKTHSPSEP
jgi:hypothetical protein